MGNSITRRKLRISLMLALGSILGFTQPTLADNSSIKRLSHADLVDVVAPIALYPDDLVAIVLPAASNPLQLVQAQRALDDGDNPDSDWDEAVVAMMNYPELLEFMNDDLDWAYNLGLAFINQENDVFAAIQDFRADALSAGNLKSDRYQDVRVDNNGNIVIQPRAKDTLYVPYYKPRRVLVRQAAPVYHYYPVARPVYYYPYPANYAFNVGHFYGVGTYFSIGWQHRGLSLSYSNYAGHPYAGISYAVSYSPRHYYFKPRLRGNVVVRKRVIEYRDHYRPRHYKRVQHRNEHRKELRQPRQRQARNSLMQEQQRKRAKFQRPQPRVRAERKMAQRVSWRPEQRRLKAPQRQRTAVKSAKPRIKVAQRDKQAKHNKVRKRKKIAQHTVKRRAAGPATKRQARRAFASSGEARQGRREGRRNRQNR